MITWRKAILLTSPLYVVGFLIGTYQFGSYRATHASSALAPCVAGPGEICPTDDFRQELAEIKTMSKHLEELSRDPKVKEITALSDQLDGMGRRMQGQISQTLTQNPGHQWSGAKEKFVPGPLTPDPAAATTGPNSPAVTGNNNRVAIKK